ncbi:restriction endonuclease subunit S [Pseudomonas sp. Irchel s3b5]|uniref:restriction endonuclease subunit S n=1 Tax=Pseudomonas sp. Irchel s3b5 TaxID=2009077 RepID=UPI000BA3BADA|nr:restriction endonuclease subunit S [Pseudomonas sp. Irchel s3b5]
MAVRYKPYPQYKDSGVEWLGVIPSTWPIARMDDLAATIKDQITPKELESKVVIHYSIPTVQEIGIGRAEEGDTIDSNKFIVAAGDVLFSKLNPRKQTISTVASHAQMAVASTEFVVLRPITQGQKYLHYMLHSKELNSFVCSQVESATKSHQRINPSVISKLKFALPPENERLSISNFLDHETAKIDNLIEKQQQLIQLLKEKRQAVISHAVTKGLDPNAKLRDSGVEWLGEVPEHWEVKQAKYIADITRGAILRPVDAPEYFDDEGEWAYLNISDATACDKYLFKSKLRLSVLGSTKSARVYPGNVIITASATIGKAFINKIKVCIHDGFIPFCNLKIDNGYLYHYLSNPFLYAAMGKSNTQKNIYLDEVKNMLVTVPPSCEQLEIVKQIEFSSMQFNSLLGKAENAIRLMQERRTALISAAVTGKIDLRDWIAPQTSQTNKEVAA